MTRTCWYVLAILTVWAAATTAQSGAPIPIVIHGETGSSGAQVSFPDPSTLAEPATAPRTPEAAGFIGAARAIGVARERGLAAGVRPWQVQLMRDPTSGEVIWTVSNTTRDERGARAGRTVVVRGRTAEVLSVGDWSVTIR